MLIAHVRIYLATTTKYLLGRLHFSTQSYVRPLTWPGTPPRTLSPAQRAFFDAVTNFDVESIERLTRAAGDDLDVNALHEFPFSKERMSALHYAAFMNETWVGIFHEKQHDCTNAGKNVTNEYTTEQKTTAKIHPTKTERAKTHQSTKR